MPNASAMDCRHDGRPFPESGMLRPLCTLRVANQRHRKATHHHRFVQMDICIAVEQVQQRISAFRNSDLANSVTAWAVVITASCQTHEPAPIPIASVAATRFLLLPFSRSAAYGSHGQLVTKLAWRPSVDSQVGTFLADAPPPVDYPKTLQQFPVFDPSIRTFIEHR